ncbi:MAG: Sua5/YciO/YrdC/YwlC family protein [Pseudomonadota bacterium]|nr:Sua5/YciO/YrdC/YwlC family protein [Pseudomonadota bacterium]
MTPPTPLSIEDAAVAVRRGGVIAYPTEAVWGLGCDPFREAAVMRLLAIKQREVGKGLILIAGSLEQLDGLLDWSRLDRAQYERVLASWPGPGTWIVPATSRLPRWITGDHDSAAVRVSAHPEVVALAAACAGTLVSTSANFSGQAPALVRGQLAPALLEVIDGVTAGETGGRSAPSTIRDAISGAVLRP